jgi:hypothetical protein
MKARTKESTREQPEAGTHMARLVAITDLGHQPGFKDFPSNYKLELTYELVNSEMESGQPFWVSEQMTNNDWEDLASARGSTLSARARALSPAHCREYLKDLSNFLELPCMVTVTHNEKGYAQIKGQAAVSGVPTGMEIPAVRNKSYLFSLDEPDMDIFNGFPEFKQNRIREALNFDETELARQLAAGDAY